ncbi:MAG: winged helix-turn-helix domain-containing protein, partial [Dialister micraerophilus]|nr:winged helix-turn-helix domain-containing protein [Dialister micraerophilus]
IIDEAKHVVTENGKEVFLTLKEFKLLQYLVINKGIVLSRDRIMEAVWDSPIEIESRTVDMHIKGLRKKIKDCDKYINTVRGIGYRLEHEKEDK